MPARISVAAQGLHPTLTASTGRVELSRLGTVSGGRLQVFGMDGYLRATLSAHAGQRSLELPVTLGTGMFRYRWDSPSGKRQGTLIYLH